MKKLKRVVSLILLVLTVACLFTGCVNVPKDDIKANVVACDTTYKRSEGKTELFILFDILNGKERDIKHFEFDVTITFYDKTTKDFTLTYDEKISYSRSSPLRVWYMIDGRIDDIVFKDFRFETTSYWKTFSGFIISTIIIYIIIAVILVALAMAEMDGILSVCAGGLVLFCVFFTIFASFSYSLYIIIGTVIALAPFLVFKLLDY